MPIHLSDEGKREASELHSTWVRYGYIRNPVSPLSVLRRRGPTPAKFITHLAYTDVFAFSGWGQRGDAEREICDATLTLADPSSDNDLVRIRV